MSAKNYTITAESVSEGHPDKICDIISDALTDAYIAQDPNSRTAIETVTTTNRVNILGEVSSNANITQEDREAIIRDCIKEIGYEQQGYHWQNCVINDHLHEQSDDISRGVIKQDGSIGAGDQGIMVGYATNETAHYMPSPIYYSHRILEALAKDRKSGMIMGFGPDAKIQLSVNYQDHQPIGTAAIVFSTQHMEYLEQDKIKEIVRPYIENILPEGWMCPEENYYVNPTGRFVIGGPSADSGLTGRKIIVDSYGPIVPHGGGAFSGKDPTKVDRSGAYMARYIAKNIVAAEIADRCTIQVAYVIGMSDPVSLMVNTHGTGKVNEEAIAGFIKKYIDLKPEKIIEKLNLKQPIYKPTASYGHFGREYDQTSGLFSWENIDLSEALKHEFSITAVTF